MTTSAETQQAPGVEARLAIARGIAATLQQEVQRYSNDAKLALYQSKPSDAILKKRDQVQSDLEKTNLLIAELERRLPAALAERLERELAEAREIDRLESEKREAAQAKIRDIEAELDSAVTAYYKQKLVAEIAHGKTVTLGLKINDLRIAYPDLQREAAA